MFTKRNQRGLTLIEIVMSLAIAGLLAATVLTGRDALRARLQFSQGIDQVTQILTTARGEATGTVGNPDLLNGGTSPNTQVYGKSIQFTAGSSSVQVATLLADSTSGAIIPGTFDPYTVTIPWGVMPTTDEFVVFGLVGSGRLQVHGVPGSIGSATINFCTGTTGTCLSGTEKATVTVDSLGNVTRVISE